VPTIAFEPIANQKAWLTPPTRIFDFSAEAWPQPFVDKIVRSSLESEYTQRLTQYLALLRDFFRLRNLELGWDGYAAAPPTSRSLIRALSTLQRLLSLRFLPSRIIPSAEGGVALCYSYLDSFAQLELLNSGETVVVSYRGAAVPEAWEISDSEQETKKLVRRLQSFFDRV